MTKEKDVLYMKPIGGRSRKIKKPIRKSRQIFHKDVKTKGRQIFKKMKTPQQIKNEVEKEEHFYRRGYELRPTGIKLKWYEWIAFWMFLDSILWYKKDFVDFIDNEGNVRRVYPK